MANELIRHNASLFVLFKNSLSSIVTVLCILSGMPAFATSPQELSGVKSEISRQKQILTTQQKELNTLQQSLKKQELDILGFEKQIKKTKSELAYANKNKEQLKQKIIDLEQQKTEQSQKLALLVKTYYITHRIVPSSNILNNDLNEERISHYYQHIAKARVQTIQDIEITKNELHNNEKQLQLEIDNIAVLLEQQNKKFNELNALQSNRKQTITKIKKNISNDKAYLSELQRNEARLQSEIAKAAKRRTIVTDEKKSLLMNGLAKQKGKLSWPIKGRVLHNFGTNQTGQISWKGIVINANYGQAVKAAYSGTVVFAEYLRGYGLVILLDHGKGDMTLYGYNQSLVKKEGDQVSTGETIALAGNTGGQSTPSLYFEIRRNSKTENPRKWLKP